MKKKQLLTVDDAKTTKKQHTKPCSDCPWARASAAGWLGDISPQRWVQMAHGEVKLECHVLLPHQCAGGAIYRDNVCKSPRDKTLLRLPQDKKRVFSSPQEFLNHHENGASRSWVDVDQEAFDEWEEGFEDA